NLSYCFQFSFNRTIVVCLNKGLLCFQKLINSLRIPAEKLMICPRIKTTEPNPKYPPPICTDELAIDCVIRVLAIIENCFCRVVQYCSALYSPAKKTPIGINHTKGVNWGC